MVGINSTKTSPLISFYALVDEDVALIAYILTHYRENNAFDCSKVEGLSPYELIGKLYKRKYKNPLYLIMRDDKYKDLLDRCYEEFLSEREANILEYSYNTDFVKLVNEFKKSGEIIPTIMYYNSHQLSVLKEIEELQNIQKVSFEYAVHNSHKYSQFYFKSIEELQPFKNKFKNTVIYISSCGLNLNDNNDDTIMSDEDFFDYRFNKDVRISIFDLYKMKLIGAYNNDNSDTTS